MKPLPLPLLLLAAVLAGAAMALPAGERTPTVFVEREAGLVLEPGVPVLHEEAVLGTGDGGFRAVASRWGIVREDESDRLGNRDEVARRTAVLAGQSALSQPLRFAHGGIVPTEGGISTALLGGWATFYATCPDCAAAGPNLRAALGPGWRGERVTVVSGTGNVTVRLTDWCGCGTRHGLPTLLDLSEEAFQELAPLSAGIVRVSIEIAGPRDPADDRMRVEVRDDHLYTLPPTDALEEPQ